VQGWADAMSSDDRNYARTRLRLGALLALALLCVLAHVASASAAPLASSNGQVPTHLRSQHSALTGPDTTPPTTTVEGLPTGWSRTPVTLSLVATDDEGGSGMSGGSAKTEYSGDGGTSWVAGQTVTYRTWKRGGGSGVHTLLYRSTDAAGNVEETQGCEVLIDARPPLTRDDASLAAQLHDTTVSFTANDSLSSVAITWHSLDGGVWQQGPSVVVPASENWGVHWVAYYSVDNAGNAEYLKWCRVTITADPETIVFVTESGTRYHRETCQYLWHSKIPKTLYIAIIEGYLPCSVCEPPQLFQ